MDCLGGVFSDLSLAFKSKFDVIAGVAYTLVVVSICSNFVSPGTTLIYLILQLMDAVVIVLALILNPLAKRRRERLAVNEHSSSENGAEANTVEAQATAGSTNDTNPPDIESGEPTRVSTPLSEKQCTQQVEKPENHDSILPPRLP